MTNCPHTKYRVILLNLTYNIKYKILTKNDSEQKCLCQQILIKFTFIFSSFQILRVWIFNFHFQLFRSFKLASSTFTFLDPASWRQNHHLSLVDGTKAQEIWITGGYKCWNGYILNHWWFCWISFQSWSIMMITW